MRLKVAIADPDELIQLEMLDVDPVLVSNSLTFLKNELNRATDRLGLKLNSGDSIISSYIDYRSNTVVLGVEGQNVNLARSELDSAEFSEAIKIVEDDGLFVLSGSVRGADGTRNLTWQQAYGGTRPCSIGASVEDGFVTAGHCGYTGNSIVDATQASLGTVQDSTWLDSEGPDVGYVETVAGLTPTAQVNGYTDGVFSISDEWAGIIEYPVGSTLCRYGQTSGGPICGTLSILDADVYYSAYSRTTTGISKVAGGCTSDGDSGGTWVAGTGQIQGTHIGGQPFTNGDACPTTFEYLFMQPIRHALDEFGVTMLTTHGSVAPQITDVNCPHSGSSGNRLYTCIVNSVDSQGEVQLLWTSDYGGSSTTTVFRKRCTVPSFITVALKATNPYGTDTKYYSFPCPNGPMP